MHSHRQPFPFPQTPVLLSLFSLLPPAPLIFNVASGFITLNKLNFELSVVNSHSSSWIIGRNREPNCLLTLSQIAPQSLSARSPPYASLLAIRVTHVPIYVWEHGNETRQLLGVVMRQQLGMPTGLAAAVPLNRCCLPTNAASLCRLKETHPRSER